MNIFLNILGFFVSFFFKKDVIMLNLNNLVTEYKYDCLIFKVNNFLNETTAMKIYNILLKLQDKYWINMSGFDIGKMSTFSSKSDNLMVVSLLATA